VISFTSCNDDHFLNEFDAINTSDAIKGMITGCAKDVSKNGMKTKLKYYSHDINSFWILNQSVDPMQDYNAYYKNWGNKNQLVKYEVNDMSIHIFPISKERASFYYQVNMTYIDSLGKQIELNLIESGTVMKLNEQANWEYLNGHSSIINM
jgi:hypothetical protein